MENNISFGLVDDYSLQFGTANIRSIFHINKRQQIAITSKDLIKFERDQIVKQFNFTYFIGCYIEKYDMMACITQQKSSLTIYMMKDTSYPLLSLFPLEQTGIFHIFYSPRSSALITIGSGIKVWNFNVEIPSSSILDPKVTITFRSQFLQNNYESNLLNLPTFDYNKEILYLPTNQGIKGYELTGRQVKSLTRLPSKNTTPVAFCQSNGKILACDPSGGLCLFGKNGDLISHYEIGVSNLISINFVDSQHAILLNCNGSVYILNLKTSKFFHVYTAYSIPNRVYVQLNTAEVDAMLVLVYQSRVVYTRIVIPWKLWAKNVICPKLIRRFNRLNEPGRIVVQTNNSFVKIFSPKTGTLLTSASSSTSASPVYVSYDRGTFISTVDDNNETKYDMFETDKRDELFIVMDNGYVHGFDTGFSPCKEVLKIDLKASAIISCREITKDGSKWLYAAARNGEAYFCDYNSLRVKCKIVTGNMKFVNLFYNDKHNCIILLFEDECALLNIEKKSIVMRLKCHGSSISFMNGDYVYIGLSTGQINIIKIVDSFHIQINENLSSQIIHSKAVSSFAFSPSFWMSVGFEGSVFIWDYSFSLICKINLPEPLYACEIINGYRDILLGTSSELMIIKGSTIWDDQIDKEMEIIDNFDKMEDQLYSAIFTRIDEEEEEAETSLLGTRHKQKKQNEDNSTTIDDDEERMRIENALNKMSLLNNGKKQLKAPPVEKSKPEEMINEEEEIKEEVEEAKKKRRRRKKRADGTEYESDYESETGTPINLDDLFPSKKEELQVEEPSIPIRVKQEWKDKERKDRPSRPNRNAKKDDVEIKLKKNNLNKESLENDLDDDNELFDNSDSDTVLRKENQQETVLRKENQQELLLKIEKKQEISSENNEQLNTSTIEEIKDEDIILRKPKSKNFEKNSHRNKKVDKNDSEDDVRNSKQIKEPSTDATKKSRLVNKSTQGDIDQEKSSVLSKSIINIPNQKTETEKNNEKSLKKQKRNKASTSLEVTKEKSENGKNQKKEKPKTSLKKRKQSPPKTPRCYPSPPKQRKRSPSPISKPAALDYLVNQQQSENNQPQSKNKKIKNKILNNSILNNTTQSHYLATPRKHDKGQEQLELNMKRKTQDYLLNLDDLPLSIVTNLDDPDWHLEMNNDVDQFESILDEHKHVLNNKKAENEERCQTGLIRINQSNGFDRLAQAVEKKCPKLIPTKPAHWLLSQSLPSDAAILPGAAWRRTAVGSRLIKSTRPKVFRPTGKVEQSLTIHSPTSPRRFNTPLQSLRQKCEAKTED